MKKLTSIKKLMFASVHLKVPADLMYIHGHSGQALEKVPQSVRIPETCFLGEWRLGGRGGTGGVLEGSALC